MPRVTITATEGEEFQVGEARITLRQAHGKGRRFVVVIEAPREVAVSRLKKTAVDASAAQRL